MRFSYKWIKAWLFLPRNTGVCIVDIGHVKETNDMLTTCVTSWTERCYHDYNRQCSANELAKTQLSVNLNAVNLSAKSLFFFPPPPPSRLLAHGVLEDNGGPRSLENQILEDTVSLSQLKFKVCWRFPPSHIFASFSCLCTQSEADG